MASISSLGLGSGIDIGGIVDQLVAVERAPTENRLNRREANLQAELSAFGFFKAALADFQGVVTTLSNASNFIKLNTASSDKDTATISANTGAASGSYNLEVSNLAQAHSLASKSFTGTTDPVGEGTLTFRFGTYAVGPNTFTVNPDKPSGSVVIDSTNNSLQGIRDAVNAADIGVRASIINDGSGYRLTFVSEDSGVENSMEITISGDSIGTDIDDIGLSQLAYDPTAAGLGSGKNLSETQTAEDASFSLNGLAITSSTNTITDAIDGASITLKGETSGAPISLSITQDTSNITSQVESFVDGYNELITAINSISAVDLEQKVAGILSGDFTIRTIEDQVRRRLIAPVEGLTGTTALSQIGITTNEDGTLSLDSSKLQDVIDGDFLAVSRLFAAVGTPTDSLVNFESSTEDTEVGNYAVNITTLATQGSYTGGVTGLLVDATNDTFSMKIDGVTTGTITLNQATYASGAALAAEIQSKINGDQALQDESVSVVVSFVTDHFEISSARYGSASKVEFTSVEGSGLGLSIGTGTDGVDVEGTIGGASASGSGRFLTGSGDAEGLKIEIVGGAVGSRGTINFTRGVGDQLRELMDSFLETDGILGTRTDGINTRLQEIADQRAALDLRMESVEARLRRQFTAMDALVAQLQATSTFLTQQLANLPQPGTLVRDD